MFHQLTTQLPEKIGTFFSPKNHKIGISGLHFSSRVKKKEKIYLMNAETTSILPLTASAPTTLEYICHTFIPSRKDTKTSNHPQGSPGKAMTSHGLQNSLHERQWPK